MINQTSETTLVQGTVASTAVHVATVATGAFAFIDAIDLSPYLGCKLTLRDSSGRTAVGYVMRAGTGEALAGELAPQDFTSGWEAINGASIVDLNTFSGDADGSCIRTTATVLAASTLIKVVLNASVVGGTLTVRYANNVTVPVILSGNGTAYFTVPVLHKLVYALDTAVNADFTSHSVQRVTEPPVTGVVIASTKGGAVQSWAATTTGFDPNAVTFYSISRVHVATVVASGNLGAGDGGLVLTDGSAKAVPTGVDISGYAGGYYFLTFQDTGGRVYGGYSGSVSDGTGLTIVTAKAGATQNWLIKTASFDKDVALAYKVYHVGY